MTKKVLLRFNNEATDDRKWRVIYDGKEHLASNVVMWVPTHTSQDVLADGRVKHHITCFAKKLVWNETELTIS